LLFTPDDDWKKDYTSDVIPEAMMDHHVTIKKNGKQLKNLPMATAWTTPPLEIVLIRCDFFCLRVVVVTDVETGEEKRSCWCVANIFCVYFVRQFGPQRPKKEQLFFSAELSGTEERERRERERNSSVTVRAKRLCVVVWFFVL
tara:strand:+ start:245 stop:676 length:432 start_codon:yes stop_codon:yes gene_type:complete